MSDRPPCFVCEPPDGIGSPIPVEPQDGELVWTFDALEVYSFIYRGALGEHRRHFEARLLYTTKEGAAAHRDIWIGRQ